MVYLAFLLVALSPHYFPSGSSDVTDSVTVFKNESYLELNQQHIDVQNISTAFNPINDHVYAFDMNSGGVLWEFKPNGLISAIDTLDFPGVNRIMPMEFTHSGKSLLFWEMGLGKVFEYSFSDSSLKRIDRTRVQDLMFGHGSVIMEDERILALGGYGLWEFRNFLLEFNQNNGEWNKIETYGETPVTPFTYNFLGYLQNEDLLAYVFVPLSAVEQETEAKDIHTFNPYFEIYTLNLENNHWTYRNDIHPVETDLAFNNRPRSRTTHSIDESRGIFVFNGRLTLKTDTYEVFYISQPSVQDMWSENFYYSENSDRWIVIGRYYDVSKQHIIVRSFPASEVQLTPVEEEQSAYIVWLGWFLGGFFSLALVYLGVYKLKNNADEKAAAPMKIELTEKKGDLFASVGGEKMDLSDPNLKQFFKAVYDLKKQEKSEILMSEFDNMIFTDQHSQPFRSKIKKKLFRLVNSKFEHPFITIDVYPLDKRYKMIVLNLDIVTIQSQNLRIANSESGNAA